MVKIVKKWLFFSKKLQQLHIVCTFADSNI